MQTRSTKAALGIGLSALLLLGGCSTLNLDALKERIEPPKPEVSDPTLGLAAADAGQIPKLKVQTADPKLTKLLEEYLAIARAIRSPEAKYLSNVEWSRLAAAAPAQAQQLVRTEGYFEARAEVNWEDVPDEPSASAGQPTVLLTLESGPPARVGRVTIEVQGDLADAAQEGAPGAAELLDAVQGRFELQEGDVFTNDAWGDAKNNALLRLRAQGYAAATWAGTSAQVDAEAERVRLFLVADSGPLFRAGDIVVEGTKHHDSDRVRALAAFDRGAAMTEARLLDYQARLLKSGLFDQVTVLMDPDAAHAQAAPIRVTVRETPLQSATLSVGYGANNGPGIGAEYAHRKLLGHALTTRQKFVLSRKQQSWQGDLTTHLDENFGRWLVGGLTERLVGDNEVVTQQQVRAGRARELPDQDRLWFAQAERSMACARLREPLPGAPLCAELYAVTANWHQIWRRLDNIVLPTEGYSLNMQLGVGIADGNLSQRGPFSRLYGRATGYWPVRWGDRNYYTQLRLEAGAVVARSGVLAPESQRFRAGGDESIRGYSWRSVAPLTELGTLTGGRYLWTASAEVARPIFDDLPMIWGAVFIDAGRAADSLKELKPAIGLGAGVRVRSPIGPLKLDLAWGQEARALKLHLTVGVTF